MSVFGHTQVFGFCLVVLPHPDTVTRLCSCVHNTITNKSIYNKLFHIWNHDPYLSNLHVISHSIITIVCTLLSVPWHLRMAIECLITMSKRIESIWIFTSWNSVILMRFKVKRLLSIHCYIITSVAIWTWRTMATLASICSITHPPHLSCTKVELFHLRTVNCP